MRKLIVSMNVTLDGFMSGPNCELDWHFQSWNTEMADVLHDQLLMADTILLGSTTYKAMARFWPLKATDLSFARGDIAFANMMNNYKKMVFSRTLKKPTWNNSELVNGDPREEIVKLKGTPGKDMIIYGSGKIVDAIAGSGVIDEYQLWVHPVLLGEGKPLFTNLIQRLQFTLFKTKTFSSGVIILYYHPNSNLYSPITSTGIRN